MTRLRRAPVVGAAAVCTALLLAACGGGEEEADERTPAEIAADELRDELAERLSPSVGAVRVTCPPLAEEPEGTVVAGEVTCMLDAGGTSVPLPVRVGDGGALRLTQAVLARDELASYLVEQLGPTAEGDVEVDCGELPVLAVDVGDTVQCAATRVADGATFVVTVSVRSVDGEVTWSVLPG